VGKKGSISHTQKRKGGRKGRIMEKKKKKKANGPKKHERVRLNQGGGRGAMLKGGLKEVVGYGKRVDKEGKKGVHAREFETLREKPGGSSLARDRAQATAWEKLRRLGKHRRRKSLRNEIWGGKKAGLETTNCMNGRNIGRTLNV